jgi:dTDP-4-dehydrorhamnose 3,5-epimerase-like enzyme
MIKSPTIISLPKITDPRGNLSFLEGNKHIPFEIKRAYWIYDVPGGENRGGHAFREQQEFIVAMSGSFDVIIDTGKGRKKKFSLNRSYFGLYVPAGCWRQMTNFSTNSIALVLASTHYHESDYIRSFEDFRTFALQPSELIAGLNLNNLHYSNPLLNAAKTSVHDCKVIELDKNHRDKGNITVVENGGIVPFDINRVYYLYDVPGGEERGGHAHKDLYQLIIAAGGSFDVVLDDGNEKRIVHLNRPYQGLKVVPGIWRELVNFSSGSCCLVMASHNYDEGDYIRDYNNYINIKEE